jgi:hypothetical protein
MSGDPNRGASLMPEFTAQIVQLAQLFANPYVVEAPAYQRAYAWTSREAGQLLEDIAAAVDADGREAEDYFLGTMLFIDRARAAARRRSVWARPGTPRVHEVIDGFQRLTTLTILFCVLRDLAADEGGPANQRLPAAIQAGRGASSRSRLTLATPDEAFFSAHVRMPGASGLTANTDDPSPAEKRILEVRDHVRGALIDFDADQRRRLVDFLLDHCCVVLVATTGIDRAHRMFTVLNATGKPLARNDILKAALLGNVPPAAAAQALATWHQAESRLGAQFESLFSHIHAMHGRPAGRVIAGILEIAEAGGGERAFIEGKLRPAANIFDDLRHARHAGSAHSAAIGRYLTYLGWHSFGDWIAPAMLRWLEKGRDAADLAWFLAALDRLAFGARILGIGGTKRTRRFGAVVAAVRSGRDLRTTDSPLAFSRQEQRTIQHNLRDLHARNAPVAKHLLLRLTDAMAGEPISLSLPGDMTVEHVLPRKLSTNSQWRLWFPDPEEREQCTESLGNLVLVTKAQNDRAGNLEFARKHDIYFGKPAAPIPPINADLQGHSEWKAEHIKAREAKLLAQIEALWSFGVAGVPAQFADVGVGSLARAAPARVKPRSPSETEKADT